MSLNRPPADGCEAGKPFTVPSTWTDILNREQARVMRLMLALRPDGHMFHQVRAESLPVPDIRFNVMPSVWWTCCSDRILDCCSTAARRPTPAPTPGRAPAC
jgi:hypothetical protein